MFYIEYINTSHFGSLDLKYMFFILIPSMSDFSHLIWKNSRGWYHGSAG